MTVREVQQVMWEQVGLFREREGLRRAVDLLDRAWSTAAEWLDRGEVLDVEGWRTVNVLTVGRLIARAALRREESRGAHYREDFPDRDDIHWQRRLQDTIGSGA